MLRATRAIEGAGVPAVAIVSSGFAAMARALSRSLGLDSLPLVLYDGVILTDPHPEFERKVVNEVAPAIIAGLLARETSSRDPRDSASIGEPGPDEVVFTGDFDAVQEHFLANLWSDGLPIVPPTPERIGQFLRFTDRDPDDVIGVLPIENRESTVHSIAVNGVMAGCRPEYMPILIAAVEAIADPEFRLQDAGSTPGWEALIVLSGALVKELDFNSGAGVLRVGRRANTTIGRFLRLYMRNVCGFRPPPGATDQGAIASTFNVVLAEDEDSSTAVGWAPWRVDRGYPRDVTLVTVQSVLAASATIYSQGGTALEHLVVIAELMAGAMGPWSCAGLERQAWYPLLVLAPGVARAIARDGYERHQLQQYLYDNLWISARSMERYAEALGFSGWKLDDVVREGRAAPEYAASSDPDRLVRMLLRPEWTGVVVAGHPGRNQSRVYLNNHFQGPPTSRVVELPRDWRKTRA